MSSGITNLGLSADDRALIVEGLGFRDDLREDAWLV
jgi:hypothetical protein